MSQDYLTATGKPSFSVNIPVENGFINVANGNLHMEFPLATHKQRGALALDEKLVYDSRIWMIGHYNNYYWWPTNVPNTTQAQGGWRFVTGAETGTLNYTLNSGTTQGTCQAPNRGPTGTQDNYVYTISWSDPSGTNHIFDAWLFDDENTCGYPTSRTIDGGYATDASGYYVRGDANGNAVVLDKNGTQVYPEVIDRYGNYWSLDNNENLVDDLGRTPVIVTTNGNVTYYDVLAPNGPINNNGLRVRYIVTTAPIQVSTQFNENPVVEWSGTLSPIQSIQLPDGSSYHFSYDSYGEMTSVTLPTGGAIAYGWSNYFDSYQNENRWLTSRTVGSNPATTFTPSVITQCSSGGTGCQEQVTVHKPSGDETVYKLTLNNGAWNTNTTAYTGSASSDTPLINVVNTYDFSNPCPNQICIGANDITKSTSVTTLSDTGLMTQTQYCYNDPYLGHLTSLKKWDYYTGSSSPTTTTECNSLPAPTTETDYTYSGYDLTQTRVLDSGGNQVSLKTYNYTMTATTTTAIVGHSTQNAGGPYLSSVGTWINTDGSTLTTNYVNDDTGTVLSSTDSNGTTHYGHDATDTFITSTTVPTPSSGVTLTSSAGYDASSGIVTSSTDANSQQTVYKNFDPFGRAEEIDYPDGGKTTYNYSSTGSDATTVLNGTASANTSIQYDSYGRKSRIAVFNGQASNPWYQIDYCYDVDGNLQFQSTEYQGTGFVAAKRCSGSGITYSYDALGRVKSMTNDDGLTQYLYTGRAVKTTDVNNVQKITQRDAFGRITVVCEISNSTMPGSTGPQSCGTDIGGTGFPTNYAYDLPSHKTTIMQGAQQRIFQTDSAGRTISTSEPERGITTYSYAYNSTGLVVTRKRSRANQTNASVLTTTITQYDSLGRVFTTSYDDGTLTKYYAYDLAANWNTNLGQSKGHLTYAWTQPFWVGTQFSYDVMGRVSQTQQCLAYHCGNYAQNVTRLYSYDLGGNLTKESYFTNLSSGTQVDTNYALSDAGEVTSISNTLTGAVNDSGAILSNVVNGSNGPTSYQFGNGLDGVTTYDAVGRPNGSWVCKNSTQYECGGGTQLYGNLAQQTGIRVNSIADTIVNSAVYFGYDEFNRLTSANYTIQQNAFTYGYDRYGNRWSQNVTQGSGPTPQLTFNTANNQVIGYSYDAAGNLLSDGMHTYTYDAEGNVLTVDGGTTAIYIYDALNRRVLSQVNGSNIEYAYDLNGQRSMIWNGTNSAPTLISATTYWNGRPISLYNGATYFQHQDVHGTERLETASDGSAVGFYKNLAFGDGSTVSGTNNDPYHFAQLDHDSESGTDHAQFRQYSPTQGRWMSPDPYNGSMDPANPQSFNRYSYVGNMPLGYTDPSGLDPITDIYTISVYVFGAGGEVDPLQDVLAGALLGVDAVADVLFGGLFAHPTFHGSLKPRPNTPSHGCGVSASSLDNYLSTKNSPMVGQGANLMTSGAQYNIDPRLFVSLSGAETTFGNNITAGQFNAFNVLYHGMNSPFSSFQSAINSVGHSLMNPRNGYDFTNTATLYGHYCSGAGCAAGLKNLNTFMNQQSANTNSLHYPCKKE
jgi:RHS repeat-associated protein